MNTTVVEIVNFKLKPNATKEQLADTHEGIKNFLQKQPGFIYRSLTFSELSGEWIDLAYWENMEVAKAASDALMQDPDGLKMVDLCDMDSVRIQHLSVEAEAMSASCETA